MGNSEVRNIEGDIALGALCESVSYVEWMDYMYRSAEGDEFDFEQIKRMEMFELRVLGDVLDAILLLEQSFLSWLKANLAIFEGRDAKYIRRREFLKKFQLLVREEIEGRSGEVINLRL